MHPNYEAYVRVFGEALREIVINAKRDSDDSVGSDSESMKSGYLLAFHRVVTLMQQTAEIYEIPSDALGVADIDENDLV